MEPLVSMEPLTEVLIDPKDTKGTIDFRAKLPHTSQADIGPGRA